LPLSFVKGVQMYSGFGKFQKAGASFLNIFSKKMPSGREGILLQVVSVSG
jgi:hypothetical protein